MLCSDALSEQSTDEDVDEPRPTAQDVVTEDVENAPVRRETPHKLRKRKSRDHMWKVNVTKAKRQSGQEYTDRSGTVHPARKVTTRKDCNAPVGSSVR